MPVSPAFCSGEDAELAEDAEGVELAQPETNTAKHKPVNTAAKLNHFVIIIFLTLITPPSS
jgi:hypothetical protein